MSQPEVWVCGVGMLTAVGAGARQTAASVRAGINRYGEVFVDDDEVPISMALVPEDRLPALSGELLEAGLGEREGRMLRLAGSALLEVTAALEATEGVPLLLALPEDTLDLPTELGAPLLDHVALQSDVRVDRARSRVFSHGRAAGLMALESAAALLLAGGAEYALVGGLDSPLDAEVVGALEEEGRLLVEGAVDGFAPGEAAAFLLLGTPAAVRRDGLEGLAWIGGPGLAREEGHRNSELPNRGEALSAAVASALAAGNGDLIRSVVCSLNGENQGVKEWGAAAIRNRRAFVDDVRLVHPADCLGDVGAAMGPLLIGLGVLGIRGGYLPGPCLVWCASDAELRAAVRVQSIASEGRRE